MIGSLNIQVTSFADTFVCHDEGKKHTLRATGDICKYQ